jgi:hypothetical protein
MPRVPAVFVRRKKLKRYDGDLELGDPKSMDNYKSATAILGQIKEQFAEEEKEHMMSRWTPEQAKKRWGDELVIAAQGALEKSDTSFRIIHDATHGVMVNPRILVRDLLRDAWHW